MNALVKTGVWLAILGCGGGDTPDKKGDDDGTVTTTTTTTTTTILSVIGSEGGNAASDDGLVTLEIPPGALAADTEISISALTPADGSEVWAGYADIASLYRLEPDGLEFAIPATLHLSVDETVVAPPASGPKPLWAGLSVDSQGVPQQTVTAALPEVGDGLARYDLQIEHFSEQGLVPIATVETIYSCTTCDRNESETVTLRITAGPHLHTGLRVLGVEAGYLFWVTPPTGWSTAYGDNYTQYYGIAWAADSPTDPPIDSNEVVELQYGFRCDFDGVNNLFHYLAFTDDETPTHYATEDITCVAPGTAGFPEITSATTATTEVDYSSPVSVDVVVDGYGAAGSLCAENDPDRCSFPQFTPADPGTGEVTVDAYAPALMNVGDWMFVKLEAGDEWYQQGTYYTIDPLNPGFYLAEEYETAPAYIPILNGVSYPTQLGLLRVQYTGP